MSQPYLGEIRMFAGNFAPAGWAFCDGTLLNISDYSVLFALLGTTYGGDGQNNFALPDLRGRVPLHIGSGFSLGQTGGVEQVTLTGRQMPAHAHSLTATTNGASQTSAAGALLAQPEAIEPYFPGAASSPLGAAAIAGAGGSQPHTNFQPYLCVSFIISLFGQFPSQT